MAFMARRLREACRNGRAQETTALLSEGADACAYYSWSTETTVCYVACQHGHAECVAALLRGGADADSANIPSPGLYE